MIGLMVVLLTFLGGGEYGFSAVGVGAILGVEYKAKIMLQYSRGMKWQQSFTTGAGFYVYNVLG